MQVGIRGTRTCIEVKDVADVRNIDTAGSDVGGDQHVDAAVGQALDSFVSLGLRTYSPSSQQVLIPASRSQLASSCALRAYAQTR